MVDKAINGQFNLIEDPGISCDIGGIAFVTANGIEYWDNEGINLLPPLCPLQDFKEMLVAWRDFLQTPPLHGTIIK